MTVFRFGLFVFDPGSGELTRDGRPVRLQPQPAQLLAALVARQGELVTRDELRRAVWPTDTFVDFERGLNFAVAQVRAALGDAAASPRYIRTVPRRGYTFICPVERHGHEPDRSATDDATTQASTTRVAGSLARRTIVLALAAATAFGGVVAYRAVHRPAGLPVVAVARFDNETGDPAMVRFGDALVDTVVEQLTERGTGRFAVVGNAAILRRSREERDLDAIASSLGARYVVLTELQRDDERLRVLAHLIRLPEQTHVKVSRTDGIADRTLPATDAIAARIVSAFAERLGATSGVDSPQAASR